MPNARPGVALKNLRKTRRWTLTDVSRRTGVPPSTLSRIENDQISPTYDLLLRLSKGLSIDLAQLLSDAATTATKEVGQVGRRSVNHKSDGGTIRESSYTVRYLSPELLNKQITPILCEYRARSLAEFGEFNRHEGEEFLYVLDGTLELHTELYAPLVLQAGESVYFDGRMGHAYIARGERACHALSICAMPHADRRPTARPARKSVRRSKRPSRRGRG